MTEKKIVDEVFIKSKRKLKKKKYFVIIAISLLLTGVMLLIAALSAKRILFIFVKNKISELLVITPNNKELYKVWITPTAKIYIDFYFFNVTNPEEVGKGKKPIVAELGPYVYRELRNKTNIKFHDNGTVSFFQQKKYVFYRNMSNGDEEDVLITANIGLVTFAYQLGFISSFFPYSMKYKEYKKPYFLKQFAIKDIVWSYYDEYNEKQIKLFTRKNDVSTDLVSVYTGAKCTMPYFQDIDLYMGQGRLTKWKNYYANTIRGTDGSAFAPFSYEKKVVSVFSSLVCRSTEFNYLEDDIVKGINTRKFRLSQETFDNGTLNARNKGYLIDRFLHHGLTSLAPCYFGAPVYLSQPNFFRAHSYYAAQIDGLRNATSNDDSFISIEPFTGAPLNFSVKLQVNVRLNEEGYTDIMTGVRTAFLPVAYFHARGECLDSFAAFLKRNIFQRLNLVQNCIFAAYFLAGIILVVSFFFFGKLVLIRRAG